MKEDGAMGTTVYRVHGRKVQHLYAECIPGGRRRLIHAEDFSETTGTLCRRCMARHAARQAITKEDAA